MSKTTVLSLFTFLLTEALLAELSSHLLATWVDPGSIPVSGTYIFCYIFSSIFSRFQGRSFSFSGIVCCPSYFCVLFLFSAMYCVSVLVCTVCFGHYFSVWAASNAVTNALRRHFDITITSNNGEFKEQTTKQTGTNATDVKMPFHRGSFPRWHLVESATAALKMSNCICRFGAAVHVLLCVFKLNLPTYKH